MKLIPVASLRGFRPILVEGREIVLSRGASLFGWRPESGRAPWPLGRLPASTARRLSARSALARRVLRLDVDAATRTPSGELLVGSRAGVHRLTHDGAVVAELSPTPHRPLRFARWSGVEGFADGLGFGDYGSNAARAPVRVHTRAADGRWRVAHTFEQGAVEHIHSLVPDAAAGCIWILTGDYDDAAGIWRATENFARVEAVVRGSQRARACVAFPREGGLLYATDSHLEPNSIRALERAGGSWRTRALAPMRGSCIYGARVGEVMVFTTAVEPGRPTGLRALDLLDPRIGPGIRARACDVVATQDGVRFDRLQTRPSDLLPKRLFQFSALVVPETIDSDLLVTYGVGVRGGHDCVNVARLELRGAAPLAWGAGR